ncbi:unnamed protein product [Rotaria socialis]|nr:unnamed protein product [Rotaria socialis]CAF4481698.1 unnamed protein product [Rotaria socialis]
MSLITMPSIDEEQRHPRAILQTNQSTISSEILNLPRTVIDVFDDIYSSRVHRRCIDFSYFTLLSMTLGVVFWVAYWISSNRCQNLRNPQSNSSICDFVIVFQVFSIISISISPFLFILMIYSWIRYSCHNPLDPIRNKFLELKLEDNLWQQQLSYYYNVKMSRYSRCLRRKQEMELHERGYGYVILSSHGIILDELILLSARTNIIDEGVIYNDENILKLTFKKTCLRPWKIHLSIYLPENYVEQRYREKLMQILKIQIRIENIFPHNS